MYVCLNTSVRKTIFVLFILTSNIIYQMRLLSVEFTALVERDFFFRKTKLSGSVLADIILNNRLSVSAEKSSICASLIYKYLGYILF